LFCFSLVETFQISGCLYTMATLIGFIYENNYTQLLLKYKTQVFDVRR
jgi:hypothetical protein